MHNDIRSKCSLASQKSVTGMLDFHIIEAIKHGLFSKIMRPRIRPELARLFCTLRDCK